MQSKIWTNTSIHGPLAEGLVGGVHPTGDWIQAPGSRREAVWAVGPSLIRWMRRAQGQLLGWVRAPPSGCWVVSISQSLGGP